MKVQDLQRQLSHSILNPKNIGGVKGPGGVTQTPKKIPGQTSFSDILNKKINDNEAVKFSAHAVKRLDDRNIELSTNALQRLQQGVEQVEKKGGRNSVIMVDDNAYVVSITNRTVVTTMPKDVSTGNVFTNIDSVVIM